MFPTILKTQQCSPQIQKFGQKWSFSPKSSKINKNWCFFKFLQHIFSVPPEVPWIWFLRSYDFFWQKYEILNKKNVWKKTTKSTFFFFFFEYSNNYFFSAFLMQKPRLFNVYLFFEKKVLFCFFSFKNCFCSKSHIFVKKSRMIFKNHTQGTSEGTLKICRRNLKKHQFLLIFDDFGKKFDFHQI